MSYGNSFTCEMLERIVASNKNTVVSYPAGTGKTTAIVDYICKNRNTGRKIIYISPTISLLDNLYDRLLDTGYPRNLIFNYHSKSKDYFESIRKFKDASEELIVNMRIRESKVILITHKRMMFESSRRFLTEADIVSGQKPLVFIDEAIEPINVAKIKVRLLESILRESSCIGPRDNIFDFESTSIYDPVSNTRVASNDAITENSRRIHSWFIRPTTKILDNKSWTEWRMDYPEEIPIQLSDNCGFSNVNYTQSLENRLINLYYLISLQIAKSSFKVENNLAILDIPVALHLMWKYYAQVIVMDATAYLSPSLYEGYEIINYDSWNFNKLTNYVATHKLFTKRNLLDNTNYVTTILDKFDLNTYNKIYIATTKAMLVPVANYISAKYNDYKIVYSVADPQDLVNNIDYSSDEIYYNSSIDPNTNKEYDKIIYITNYGRTRGSNVFRNCDCVIQVGTYRYPIEVIELVKCIYKTLDYEELPVANFIQELYRGGIRCDNKMDSISIIDNGLFNYIRSNIPEFKMNLVELTELNESNLDLYEQNNNYGVHEKYIKILRSYKDNNITEVSFDDLMRDFDITNRNNMVRTIRRLSDKYEELNTILDKDYLFTEFGKGKVLKIKVNN